MPKHKHQYTKKEITSPEGRERVALEHEYLMKKIVNQWEGRCPLDRDLLYMQARYGLVYAMDHYKEDSTQTFSQYAAYCMKNWILNGISEFGSTVKLSAGRRKKLMDAGESVYNTVSIDQESDQDRNPDLSRYMAYQSYELDFPDDREYTSKLWSNGFKKLYSFIDRNFDKRSRDMFYSYYNLNGYKKMRNKDLADKYGVTAALVSQSNKHVLDKIRSSKRMSKILNTIRSDSLE